MIWRCLVVVVVVARGGRNGHGIVSSHFSLGHRGAVDRLAVSNLSLKVVFDDRLQYIS
jgi:hypothetical protein